MRNMNFTKHFNSIRILTALACCFVVGASTLAAQVACGDIITSPAALTGNLTCVGDAGPALTVMGPGGKLNLKGFTVDCNNDDDATDTDGILLTGSKALVHSGTVTDCTDGVVLSAPGKHHVANITSELNSRHGFEVPNNMSNGNKLNTNTTQDNGGDGFHVGGPGGSGSFDNSFVANLSDSNGTSGLPFRGFGLRFHATGGGKVNGNTFSNNRLQGIFVDRSTRSGRSLTIHGNTIFNNGAGGILVSSGLGGNIITANMITGGGNGIVLSFADNNRLEGNIVTGGTFIGIFIVNNSTDNCPASAGNGEQCSAVTLTEGTHEKNTKALHSPREGRHSEAASGGQGAGLEALRRAGAAADGVLPLAERVL